MLIDDIRQGESAELELKRAPNEQPERWLKTVVAFANCKGGRIGNSIRLIVKRGHANHVGDNRGDNKGDNRGGTIRCCPCRTSSAGSVTS